MDFRDEKLKAFHMLLEAGLGPTDLRIAMKAAGVNVPEEMKEKWIGQMTRTRVPEFGKQKLLNRFFLGADPEFILNDGVGEYFYAEQAGLDTLRAFGADMSGRQAELRVYPSRSVVNVLASVLDTLRWMNVFVPYSQLGWIAPAYYEGGRGRGDGVGGHIHFGRKRPHRAHEIRNLDVATQLLLLAGVLDGHGQVRRLKNTAYGKASDYRLQPHGYEYRSIPSWLSSPEVAFLTLTIAKLTLLQKPEFKVQAAKANLQILSLLAAYKGVDDDAALAYAMVTKRGMPQFAADNFKGRWGIATPLRAIFDEFAARKASYFVPEVIKPCDASKRDIYNVIANGTAIPVVDRREITWDLFKLPRGVHNVEVTPHYGGLSEIGSGLVSKGIKVVLTSSGSRNAMVVESSINFNQQLLKDTLKKELPKGGVSLMFAKGGDDLVLRMPTSVYGQDHVPVKKLCQGIRELIANPNVFPICRGNKFRQVKWPETYAVQERVYKLIGKQI